MKQQKIFLYVLFSIFILSNCSRTNYIYNSKIGEDEVTIELIPSSVKFADDTLYFSYKITNNTNENLLFYHLQYLLIKLETDTISYDFSPRTNILIIDKNNKLPLSFRLLLPGFLEKITHNPDYDKFTYLILPSRDSSIFNKLIYIGNYNLEKGEHSLALEYFSFDKKEFMKDFKKKKKEDKRLENYQLFRGIIHSDTCSFTLPETIDPAEKFRKKHKIKNDSQ